VLPPPTKKKKQFALAKSTILGFPSVELKSKSQLGSVN
jgi:hypothetical protein